MGKVLVAYASKYGSNREIAEAIAARLRELGVDADVRAAGDVRGLDGYSAVVLGVALYFFRWLGEAHKFVRRNRSGLTSLPVAVFGSGPIEDTLEQFAGGREHLDKGLAKHAWLTPRAVAVFGGRVEPDSLRFPDNNPAFKSMGARDLRDWDAIRDWADGLPDALGLKAAETT